MKAAPVFRSGVPPDMVNVYMLEPQIAGAGVLQVYDHPSGSPGQNSPEVGRPDVLRIGVHRQGCAGMDRRRRRQDRLYRARQSLGERLLRELRFQAPRRAAQRGIVLEPRRGENRQRELATALQYTTLALDHRLQAAQATRPAMAGPAAPINRGRKADHALVSNLATNWGQARAGLRSRFNAD